MEDNNEIKQETVNTESNVSEPVNSEPQQTNTGKNTSNAISSEYKPISMWGYFGYEILFSIPIIGFICIIIFSVGGTGNINLKNFARSRLCLLLLVLAIFGIMFFTVGIAALIRALPRLRY
ncbi:MAG: hypothetical protein IJP71_02215 [Lachnospiraceae bacterium]|nr:hypothetical protein [Lachnospiraceae bacterium]